MAATMKKMLMKLPASGNPVTLREVLAGVDEDGPVRMDSSLAPLMSPTVGAKCHRGEQHMPTGRLKMGADVRRWIRNGCTR